MHAIYHPEYKTERELDDAIARLEQAISEKDITYCPLSAAPDLREELLYDLVNRRDDGELRWIKPSSYLGHCALEYNEIIGELLNAENPVIKNIPFAKKD